MGDVRARAESAAKVKKKEGDVISIINHAVLSRFSLVRQSPFAACSKSIFDRRKCVSKSVRFVSMPTDILSRPPVKETNTE